MAARSKLFVLSMLPVLISWLAASAFAADLIPKAEIIAEVNGKAIFNLEVDKALLTLTAAVPAADKNDARLRAGVLNLLIDRRLVETALEKDKQAVTAAEIDLEINRLKAELARSKQTLEQFLAKSGQTESLLRADLAWQIARQNYLKNHADETALAAFFKAHHRDFDDTKLRVSHILLRPMSAGDDAAVATLVKDAAELRARIVSGDISFAAAAEKYSAGPSHEHGGDLGFIPRHGVMVEEFARPAFALKKGEVSPPVATVFGIHLITVTEEKPGEKSLAEVHDVVRQALSEQLFKELADRERAKAKISFTGKGAFFKPGTTELVAPASK